MVRVTRLLTVLLLTALALNAAPAAALVADTDTPVAQAEAAFVEAINVARATEGLAPLLPNADLAGVARGWSEHMASVGTLSHNPGYTAQYAGDWVRMAENVGTATYPGSTAAAVVERLHRAFMDSAGHRANILGDFNQVGVGVVIDGATTWVTVNFLQGPVSAGAEAAPVAAQPRARGHFTRG